MRIPVVVSAVAIAAWFGVSPGWAQGETSTLIPPPAPVVTPGSPPYLDLFMGFGLTENFTGGYVGGVYALNRNLWTDGFVVRGEAQLGQYDATSLTSDDVWVHGASLLVGYRAKIGSTGLLTGYIGANYETHENDDRFAAIRGTEVGVRGLLEYYTQFTPYVDFFGMASYSTAHDTAFLFSRVGFKVVENVWVGPEAGYFRNDAPYREQRVGGFLRFDQTFTGGGIAVAAGYLNPLSDPEDGWYASLNLNWSFR